MAAQLLATEEQTENIVNHTIAKVLLGIASTVIMLLLAIVSYYLQKNIQASEELTKSMNTFNTYMQTNNKDVEILQATARENKENNARQDKEINSIDKRVLVLESK